MNGTIAVLIVGWIWHRRYDATRSMIVLALLIALELITYVVFGVAVGQFFTALGLTKG